MRGRLPGIIGSAPIEFSAAQDVTSGGVLLARAGAVGDGATGAQCRAVRTAPRGYYGLTSILLLLALLALARIPSLEQLRYQAPGEWGQLLGLDRIPEVRTLREKLKISLDTADTSVRATC